MNMQDVQAKETAKYPEIWLGNPYPLGATWTEEAVNFAVFSETASAVDLCLFHSIEGAAEQVRIHMTEQTDQVWHVAVPGLQPGQLYGYRVFGSYEPERGARFNSSKLLIDPYSKAVAGDLIWSDETFGYPVGNPAGDLVPDYRDDAWCIPRSVVIDTAFDWGRDVSPRTPLHSSIIYEAHVKGFTYRNHAIPDKLRGTYAGLGSPVAIEYLQSLGVTAVELLPVHHHVDERSLIDRGLKNYWGYNSIAFFAPNARYSSSGVLGEQVREFKTMVKNLHAARIEVILDVVFNHTAEGNHLGPTLGFRSIDNQAYYRLVDSNPRYYMDYTGTGNTVNAMHPRVLQMIMDSLRYWVLDMHVDGFRFDLAAALARDSHRVSNMAAFFETVHQDPFISQVKLIAEPWDVGEGGYQVGNFPVLWAEWNGRYRDSIRRFWKGDDGLVGEIAYRLSGSSDLYQTTGRRPYASINFVTAHDGFTLNDLVTYGWKHNEANGEDNRDGDNNNNSWNCGVEGPTDDAEILQLREQQRRNFLATMFLSQGVPMLCAGDEFGRTQGGNNNAYCQDNEISWLNWQLNEASERLLRFARRLIAFRREHPVFRRPKFFQGRPIRGAGIRDIMWFDSTGAEMTNAEWSSWFVRVLGMLLSGATMDVRDPRGRPIQDGTFLVMLNAYWESVPFILPGKRDVEWELIIDTSEDDGFLGVSKYYASSAPFDLGPRSLGVFGLHEGTDAQARAEAWQTAAGAAADSGEAKRKRL